MQESGPRIRVQEQLRLDFLAACRANDLTASQVVRKFMKQYIVDQLSTSVRQAETFTTTAEETRRASQDNE